MSDNTESSREPYVALQAAGFTLRRSPRGLKPAARGAVMPDGSVAYEWVSRISSGTARGDRTLLRGPYVDGEEADRHEHGSSDPVRPGRSHIVQ